MESSIFRQVAELVREHKTAARAMAVFLCLALVVTAATVGILTFTGHAMTQQVKVLTCPLVVHEHTPSCKNAEGELVCGYADYVVHVHNDDCRDENGTLVCPLPEIWPHVHEDSCYEDVKTPICGQEEAKGHEHTEECFDRQRGELTCTQEEHTHGDACFNREEVLTCDKTEQAHTHNDSCYTVNRELSCGEEESETHTHSGACYTEVRTLICDKTTELHNHGPECYTVNEALICEIPEHTHTDDCYAWTETLTCQIPEGEIPEGGHVHTDECFETRRELICGKLENHEHTDACFVLDGAGNRTGNPICGKIELLEHVHGEGCFTMEERQVENDGDGLFFFETTGDDPEVPAPEYICGKIEHTHSDECRDENGEIMCGLEEHTHDESCLAAPEESAAPEYICGLTEHTHDESCRDESGEIVCGLEEHIHTETCLTPAETEEALTKTCQDSGVLINVTYTAEAQIPEEAELRAAQITASGDIAAYERNMEEAIAAVEGQMEVSKVLLYDIGFYLPDETKVEPAAPVTVTVQFLDENGIPTGVPVTVVHFAGGGPEILESVSDENGVSFKTGSFSPFSFLVNFLDGIPDLAIIFGDGTESAPIPQTGDMTGLLDGVTIKDNKGEEVTDGKLYVGESYSIHMEFQEGGMDGNQFKWDKNGQMTYQIPSNFQVTPRSDVSLEIDGVLIGKYSVDADGRLTIELTEEGKQKLEGSTGYTLFFDMDATAQKTEGGSDADVHFGDTGEDFKFVVTDQPRLDVQKSGGLQEDADGKGGTLSYTVTTTVEHGTVENVQVTDVLTPPQTDAIKVGAYQNIKVTLKRATADPNSEPIELTSDQYELIPGETDPENPEKQTFIVKLKDPYATLYEGDVLNVSYEYDVDYNMKGVGLLSGSALNEVTVHGSMPLEDPDDPEGKPPVEVEEKQNSNVWINVTTTGDGLIFKDQHYDEATHKLHYTLYTVIPKGTWEPLFIQDDMYVNYGGERWYIEEFKKDGGRVALNSLTVRAVDLPDGQFGWKDNEDPDKLQENLQTWVNQAQPLTGFDFYTFDVNSKPEGYEATNVDQYVHYFGDRTLYIIFGFDHMRDYNEYWGNWGSWNHDKDRLVITEYDLDLSGEAELTVKSLDTKTERTLTPEQILHAGVTNNVNLRFSKYNPGYSVFFNNIEKINKTGVPDKNTNTIDYTVTVGLSDDTVRDYFKKVGQDVYDSFDEYNSWDYQYTMQAEFYDVLPEGWEYVPGSLYAVTTDRYGNTQTFAYLTSRGSELSEDGRSISAPLINFFAGNYGAHDAWSNDDLTEISFHYKLKATRDWLMKHADDESAVDIDNHAEIKDKNMTHWGTDETVPYLPNRLTKTAEQDGTSNLITFTLDINPAGADLDKDKDYLIVTDDSTGIQINPDNIKVTDKGGTLLTGIGNTTVDATLGSGQWGFLPTEDEHQFKLKIPDSVALQITYDALIIEVGDGVEVTNKASIDGVARSDSSYEGALKVDDINAGGGGKEYHLTIVKVDSENNSKKLPNAKFELYAVKPESGTQSAGQYKEYKEEITIGETTYQCRLAQELTTDADGSVPVESKNLEPGRYYILKEITAPAGYELLEEPVLFYFGLKNDDIDPTVDIAPPDGMLTVGDPPVAYSLPESGGEGLGPLYAVGLGMMALSAILLLETSQRKRKGGEA